MQQRIQTRFEYSANNSMHCYVYNVVDHHVNEGIEIAIDVYRGVIDIYVNLDSIPSNETKWFITKQKVTESLEIANIIAIQPNELKDVSNIYTLFKIHI